MPTTTNLVTREDTLLGVCQGLGEEFGFNPNYLRIALAALLLVSPMAVVGIYLALGVALMIGRWWWPVSVASEAAVVVDPSVRATAANDGNIALAEVA